MTVVIKEYASHGEFLDHVKNDPIQDDWSKKHHDYRSAKPNDPWYGGSWDDAVQWAEEGWKAGTDKLVRNLSLIRQKGIGKTRVYDVGGDFPIVPRYLGGTPDYMYRRGTNDASKKPILRLCMNGTVHCGIQPEGMINYGVGLVSIIDTLESTGYQVELMLMYCTTCMNGDRYCVKYPIKHAGQPVDLDRLAFLLANPTNFRRFHFQDLCIRFPERDLGGFLGSPMTGIVIRREILTTKDDEEYIKILPSSEEVGNCRTPQDGVQLVSSHIKRERPELINTLEGEAA